MTQDSTSRLPGSVLIVEDDLSLAQMVSEELQNSGVMITDIADNGGAAWELCQKQQYDMILLDWKIPGLSSLALFNRFKQDSAYHKIPILVMSGYLRLSDFSLLGEFHNTASLEKPFGVKILTQKIRLLSKEAQWFGQQETHINDLVQELKLNDNLDLKAIQMMIEDSPNPLPVAIIFGRTLRQMKCLAEADQILKSALQYHDHPVILAELGKLYLESGKPDLAIDFLNRASEKSPDNLERICDLGDLHLQNMETDKAEDLFSKVQSIDPECRAASSGKTLARNIEKWLTGTISIPDTFAGILNAIGINMVRSGHFSNGIEHYHSALSHVSDERSKAKLYFNLGLGYLRWQKPDEALHQMEQAILCDPEHEKAERHLREIRNRHSADISQKESHFDMDPASSAGDRKLTDDNDIYINSKNTETPKEKHDLPETFMTAEPDLM